MSEYQLYQFKAIDRALTDEERTEIGSWSSRTTPTATSATFSYSYGDFPKDEEKVVEEYFDIMLYLTNWGTKRLLLRLPKDISEEEELSKYFLDADHDYEAMLQLLRRPKCLLLDFNWSDDEGDGWIEEEDYRVEDFVPIREGILHGDYRALYLFWLKLSAFRAEWADDEEEEDLPAPPVPPNLQNIDPALQTFIDFFEIDEDLVAAAQQISQDEKKGENYYRTLLLRLPEVYRFDFLVRLANGELHLDIKLRKMLESIDRQQNQPRTPSVPIEEVLDLQTVKEQERLKKEEQQAAAAHRKRMNQLAKLKDKRWQDIYLNLERKTGKAYETAVQYLVDLRDLAEFHNRQEEFLSKLEEIKNDYGRSKALMRRFQENGL